MGYSYRNNGEIRDFWPDDTETTCYISGQKSIQELIDIAKNKFGNDIDLSEVLISSEYIHTSCLTYDSYDPSDYTTFIVIEKIAR